MRAAAGPGAPLSVAGRAQRRARGRRVGRLRSAGSPVRRRRMMEAGRSRRGGWPLLRRPGAARAVASQPARKGAWTPGVPRPRCESAPHPSVGSVPSRARSTSPAAVAWRRRPARPTPGMPAPPQRWWLARSSTARGRRRRADRAATRDRSTGTGTPGRLPRG